MSPQTIPGNPSTSVGTSSGEDFQTHLHGWLLLLNRAPTDLGTAPTVRWGELPYIYDAESTVSCAAGQDQTHAISGEPVATRRAISELRRLSGLTWEQLGQLFEVSRRSVHFWASGRPLSAEHERRLMRVLDIVRYADRGNARSTRRVLLNPEGGPPPFDLLAAQRFDEARFALGQGSGRAAPARTELSSDAKTARRPLPPGSLFGAKHDPVHLEPGRGRIARTARNKRRGRS